MNRKLHTPIIACTVAAFVLAAGLLVAGPALSAGVTGTTRGTMPPAHVRVPAERTRAAAATDAETEVPRPRARRARSGFALPYFSFARGSGGRS